MPLKPAYLTSGVRHLLHITCSSNSYPKLRLFKICLLGKLGNEIHQNKICGGLQIQKDAN